MQRQSWRTQPNPVIGWDRRRSGPGRIRLECDVVAFPTGSQYEIRSADCAAVITELGATLRSLQMGGHDIVRGFSAEKSPSGGSGQQLLPWPNRIRDGRYEFEGKPQQLALTEPARHNASHGLGRYLPWRLLDHQDDAVTLQLVIYPQPGWPGILQAQVTYRVDAAGLTVEVEVANLGDNSIPFGYGAHPYLTVGETVVDEVILEVPASRYLVVDDRLLPADLQSVDGTEFDWRTAHRIDDATLDTAFTDLSRGADGRWEVNLRLADRCTYVWGDEHMRWTQVFTGGPSRDISVAVEPMTCGPDAFNPGPTHDDLLVLQSQQIFRLTWGIGSK
jgi:aldose 1-epimerase